METTWAEVGSGVRLTVDTWPGDDGAVPYVLVHGLASNARMWRGVAARLAARGHAVAAVDLRGHGRSDKPRHGYDFATVTADVAAVAAALGLDRPVVAGQSWGGNVVLELAARHPDVPRGVVCLDGGTIELSRRFATWEEAAAALAPPRIDGMTAGDFEALVRRDHAGWPESGIDGVLANVEVGEDGQVRARLSREHHMTILRALWEHRPSTRYPRVAAPVLLITAESQAPWAADKRADVEEAVAAIPTARSQWLTGHHDLHAEQPDAVARLLLDAVDDGFFT